MQQRMAVTFGKPAELGGAEAAQRAALRTMHERRARLWRRLALVVIVSGVIVALLIAQRDNQTRRYYREQIESLRRAFEAGRASTGSPPSALGVVQDNPAWELCYFNPTYVDRAARRGRSGVAAMRAPVNLIFHPEGRFLLMFDGREYHVEWIDEVQFRDVAASLGLGLAASD